MTPITVSLIVDISSFLTPLSGKGKTSLTLRVPGAKFNCLFSPLHDRQSGFQVGPLSALKIKACLPDRISLLLQQTVTQNDGMVSVVFLLIIAFRPLIQFPRQNVWQAKIDVFTRILARMKSSGP